MVPDIAKTAELVQEISAASEEQAGGVSQITGAMQQLDQVTQQNSAASEELAATAEEMRTQSQSLLETISFFRLPEQESNRQSTATSRETNGSGLTNESDKPASSQPIPIAAMAKDSNVGAVDENQFERF